MHFLSLSILLSSKYFNKTLSEILVDGLDFVNFNKFLQFDFDNGCISQMILDGLPILDKYFSQANACLKAIVMNTTKKVYQLGYSWVNKKVP